MNISKLFAIFLVAVLLLTISCGGKKETGTVGLDINVKETSSIRFAYLENVGPYDAIGERFTEIGAMAAQQQLSGNVIGVFFSDPEKVPAEQLRCELGIQVPPEFEAPEGFKVREIQARTVAYTVLKGPYEEIAEDYKKIFIWVDKNDYRIEGPALEIYLKGGPEGPPQEYLTEVRIPVMKKG
ncbi:MAG: GyrI-like domain-containing protein [Candidatus Zixiibacteriota bacterium]